MSERTIAVRLTARISEYQRAMDEAAKSTRNVGAAGADLKKLGGQMVDVGQKMTVGVTLPLLGAGAAAVSLSNSFDATFGSMVGLAGVPAAEIDGLKESVLDLAGETARAPQELAEALYFAASAGLDSAQAMDAVTVAAKASQAGLGSTVDVVGLAASAVASYGAENITAAEATDILVSTIREGRAEPAELAGTLGRVLPIAAQLGVTFDEVGGAVAVLSNVFGDTNRTVTATQGLLVKLLSPTQQGRDALAEMGTSVGELHAAIDSDGLLGALELLKARGFDTNATALRALFDDIEGFQAASALLATDQTILQEKFGATANAAGSLQTAVGALDEDSQKMRQSWVDIQVALIQVGEVVGPIIADIAGGAGDLAGAFAELDPALQTVIIGILGLVAAAGPLLVMTGSVLRNYKELKVAMSAFTSAAGGSTTSVAGAQAALGRLAITAGLAVAAFESLQAVNRGLRDDVSWLAEDASWIEKPFQLAGRFGFALGAGEWGAWTDDVTEAQKAAMEMFGAMSQGVYTMDQFTDRLDEQGVEVETRNALIIMFRAQLDAAAESEANYAEYVAETTGVTDEATTAAEARSTASQGLVGAFTAENLALAALTGGLNGANDSISVTTRAAEFLEWQIDSATKSFERMHDELSDRSTYLDVQEELGNTQDAVWKLYEQFHAGTITQTELQRELERQLIADKEAVLDYAEQIGDIPPAVATDIMALIDQGLYDEAMAKLAELERERIINVRINTGQINPNLQIGGGRIVVDGNRAAGGPVRAGGLYRVNEGGRSELLNMGGEQFLMAARDGHVTPLSGGGMSGGGSIYSTVNMGPGAVVIHGNADGADVVRKLDAFFRQGGQIPNDMRRRLVGTG